MYEDDNQRGNQPQDQFGFHSHSWQQEPPRQQPEKKKMGYGKKLMAVISLGLFFGICGGLGFQAITSASAVIQKGLLPRAEKRAPEAEEKAVEAIGGAEADAGTKSLQGIKETGLIDNVQPAGTVVTDVTHVVKSVMPAVVSVNSNVVETYNFYGREISNEGVASGSGIIVGENETELLIATNQHVVYGTQKLEIQFVDGSSAEAQVKGSEPSMDIAVVAVKLADISPETRAAIAIATLGDSDGLTVGEPAIAIGNAMGYGQSVTTGVISALNRESSYSTGEAQVSSTFIQTDAAINPGNSGGALLNIKGEVIGINSNKAGGTMIEGMGYAIPISAAKPILSELMTMETRGRVAQEEKGYMGITGITVEDQYAMDYNLPKGVYVTQVYGETPAEKAGLIKGDIITRFDGAEILSWEALTNKLNYYHAGETVTVTFMRGDAMGGYQENTAQITLDAYPAMP